MDSSASTPPPTSSTAMNSDKLSGQLIIKAQLNDDIRKMMIHNEDLTLNELVLMMERVFSGKISNSDELTIKYLDDDGDKITLLTDSDLTVALHFHKLLRLFVSVNGNEGSTTNSTSNLNQEGTLIDAKIFRNELQDIRNSVQTILDRLQLSTNEIPTTTATTTTTVPSSTVVSNTTREFEPYKHLYQQQRPATPDSIPSNSNYSTNNEHQTAPTVDTQQLVSSTDANQRPSSIFQQTQMPTPHYVPSVFNHDQQVKSNIFGPPPTTFPSMPPLSKSTARFTPAGTPNSSTPPTFNSTLTPPNSSVDQSSAFIGQQTSTPPQQSGFYSPQAAPHPQQGGFYSPQAAPPPQQGGFYVQQQALSQQKPPAAGFTANNTFTPPQATTPSSSPATINSAFFQPPPPSTASQPSYGAYPPQNSYYNPVQPYPKAS